MDSGLHVGILHSEIDENYVKQSLQRHRKDEICLGDANKCRSFFSQVVGKVGRPELCDMVLRIRSKEWPTREYYNNHNKVQKVKRNHTNSIRKFELGVGKSL